MNLYAPSFFVFLVLLNFELKALVVDSSNEIEKSLIKILDTSESREYQATSFISETGDVCFYTDELIDNLVQRSKIFLTCETSPGSNYFTTTEVFVNLYQPDLIYNLNVIKINDKNFLYFTKVKYFNNNFQSEWYRVELLPDGSPTHKIQKLIMPFDSVGQSRPWFYPYVLKTKDVISVFEFIDRKKQISVLNFSITNDEGLNFNTSNELYLGGQLTRFAAFLNQTWAFGFQVGFGPSIMDFVILSNDQGKSLSQPIQITDRINVHDLYMIQRQDGELDIYYIVADSFGFSLFRRKLTSLGQLGVEEKLTKSYNVQKPKVIRRPDNSLWIHFAIVFGNFAESGHYGFSLYEDAP